MKEYLWIAGPCAAESESQIWETAVALKATGKVSLFRCGIWKARTMPETFAGMGEAALPVLKKVEDELQLPVCVEAASARHIEEAAVYGISHFWIGARTTVNPFQVQEIAEASKGLDLDVMIKNPIAPDIKLWEGAFERFRHAGIRRLKAVYRGFSTASSGVYRNQPLWNLAIEWKRQHPELPLLCDPSHIAGNREWVKEVAQKALFLDFDGLMVEVHPHPENALSDARQQLLPSEYGQMMDSLRLTAASGTDAVLEKYRSLIDTLDREWLEILSRRMEICRDIARYKQEKHLSLYQMQRWNQVLSEAIRRAEDLHLDPHYVESVMQLVHEASLEEQQRILDGKG